MAKSLVRLSPPWNTYANKIKYTFGQNDLVIVNDLVNISEFYLLIISIFDEDVAQATRQILPETVCFGNVTLNILIFNSKGTLQHTVQTDYTPQQLSDLLSVALCENSLFKGTYIAQDDLVKNMVGDVTVIINKTVVQFFNDDLSDLCNNYNEVAAKVFKEVTIGSYNPDLKLNFTTYDENCSIIQDIIL